MEQPKIDDWRNEISETKEQLKIKDGETKIVVFADEGKKNIHPDFGTSIVFSLLLDGEKEPRSFFVRENNYNLLQQIKSLGTLTGQKVKLSRTGSTKSNTRYKVEKV